MNTIETKQCKTCHVDKPFEAFAKAGICYKGKQKFRNVCKECHSSRVWNANQEKQIEKRPKEFVQCEGCLSIFHVSRIGGTCPNCFSMELKRGDE